jgi:ABC-type dipeptide/oligopeptide/nickel transport system permease component
VFRYVAFRVAQGLFLVVAITFAVFFILRISEGDPARIAAPMAANPDVINTYKREFGTDRPILSQLTTFLSGIPHGDFGTSFRYLQPVTSLIKERFPATLELALLALLLSVSLSVSLGVLSARRPGSIVDWISGTLAMFGQSAPSFWVGLLLVAFIAVRLGILPAGGNESPLSLVLPTLTVAVGLLPTELRVLRASMREVLGQDYIRAARAFGLPEWRINFVYALRNAVLPMMTLVGLDMGYLLGGVIVAEGVFNYNGIGQLALLALNSRDYPLIQGITVMTSSAFIGLNIVTDLLYSVVDPRVRIAQAAA